MTMRHWITSFRLLDRNNGCRDAPLKFNIGKGFPFTSMMWRAVARLGIGDYDSRLILLNPVYSRQT